MTAPTRQHIFIYDHPESKIKFLEATLRGQDWMASIVVPPMQTPDPQSYVNDLEKELKGHGFLTSQSAEADGTISLHLHHLSNHTSYRDALDELGLIKGSAFTVNNTGMHLSKFVSGAMRYTFQMIQEPARLFSAIYLIGDSNYLASGFFSKKDASEKRESILKPKNLFSSLSGALALAQSLIVIHYGNNGGELNYSELKNQFHQGERAGIDAMNVKGWTAPDMNKRLLGPFDDIARKHPIEAGSWAQILGQVSLAASSGFSLRDEVKNLAPGTKALPLNEWMLALRTAKPEKLVADGLLAEAKVPIYKATREGLASTINLVRTAISISAWTILMHPSKEGKVTASWMHPLDRLKQEYDYHPERMAGAINMGASLTGITASHFKDNKASFMGEAIWLAGDIVMMFVHNNHYGGKAAEKEVPLIDAATRLLQEMPVVVSASRQKAMVSDLALHLAQKTVDDKTDSDRARTAPVSEEIATLKQGIETGVNANLSMINTYYSRVLSACSILVERFAPAQREGVILALTHGIAAAPAVYATEEEIAATIRSRVDMKAGYGLEQPGMGSLARDIAQIVTAAPPIAKAGIGTAIYDAVMPLMKQGPHDTMLLSKAIEDASRAEYQASAAESHVSKLAAHMPPSNSFAKV